MGGLTAAGGYFGEVDLTYILSDNEQNKSTGGQNTYQGHLGYSAIAKSSGFGSDGEIINILFDFDVNVKNIKGLSCIHVKYGIDD